MNSWILQADRDQLYLVSQEGCFRRLLELTSPDPDAEWTDEQKLDFGSANHRFCVSFKALGGDKLPLTNSDTLLIFIDIYGYEAVKNMTEAEMKEKIKLLWDEFLIESKGREVELHMEPTKLGRKKLMDYFRSSTPKKVMVAFVSTRIHRNPNGCMDTSLDDYIWMSIIRIRSKH